MKLVQEIQEELLPANIDELFAFLFTENHATLCMRNRKLQLEIHKLTGSL